MKYSILKYVLVLALVPFMFSCESMIEPQDKWPVMLNYSLEYNYDCVLELFPNYMPKKFTIPADYDIVMLIDVQTYYANQAFDIKFMLEDVVGESTLVDLVNISVTNFTDSYAITETKRNDHVYGSYISGDPPQGVIQFEIIWASGWFPSQLGWWYQMSESGVWINDRYLWHYRAIIEDDGGRSDTFAFNLISTLDLIIGEA